MSKHQYRFETMALHAGQTVDPTTLSRAVPIYRTSSYIFKNTQHAANLFALKELGNIYTRLTNPTTDALEQRIAMLEGGVASVAFASGTAAIHSAIVTLASHGDHLVSAANLYGGTYTMFDAILPQFGISTTFVDPHDAAAFDKAVTEKTRAIFVEAIGNPALDMVDLDAVSAVAKKHKLPLIVDGTFTTPYLLRAIERGADIVINSITKWIGGHGTAIGGMVTDAGRFDWRNPRFPLFNEPDPNYHGMRWAHDLPAPLIPMAFALRLRTVPLRNLGACLSPDNAWVFIQGLETLSLRMERHSANAMTVARFLKSHPSVAWVRYPGLPDDPAHVVAKKLLRPGLFGGMVVFGVKGGYNAAIKLIDGIELFSHLANVGDAKSLLLHPASTTHSQLSEDQLRLCGITPDMIRLSIGLEHPDDLIDALGAALEMAHT